MPKCVRVRVGVGVRVRVRGPDCVVVDPTPHAASTEHLSASVLVSVPPFWVSKWGWDRVGIAGDRRR